MSKSEIDIITTYIRRRLSFENIIKEFQSFDNLKLLLFNDLQRYIFENLRNKTFSLFEEEESLEKTEINYDKLFEDFFNSEQEWITKELVDMIKKRENEMLGLNL